MSYRVVCDGVVHLAVGVLPEDIDSALPDGDVVFAALACDPVAIGRRAHITELGLYSAITCLACIAKPFPQR
jgi:hypothetical protein